MEIGLGRQFFDGLYSYEMIMLVLGVLMFLVLLFVFIYQVLKQRPFVSLLAFFVIPIVLIGFPGISSVKISKDLVELQTKAKQVEQNPNDQVARQQLQQTAEKVAQREFSSPQALTTIARAQLILGDQEKAQANVDKALSANPKLPDARQLKQKIELVKDVETLTQTVEAKPTDEAAKAKLQQKVDEVARTQISSPTTYAKVARAQAALDQKEKAQSTINKALIIDPKSIEANKVNSQIKALPSSRFNIAPAPTPKP